MRSWVVWSLILTLITYGSFKSLAWYHVNRLLLQIKSAAELHVAFRHGWIGSSITGEITIHDVEITPFQLRQPLTVDEVVVRFDSVFDLLNSFSLFSDDDTYDFPEQLEIAWQNLVLPVSANWAAYFPAQQLQEKFFGLACGNIAYLGADELASMGYDNIPFNGRISYDYERSNNILGMSVDAQFEGLGRYLASVDLQLAHPWQWPPPEDAALPRLSSLGLSFEDKSLIRRATLLCGKAGDYNKREFIQASRIKTKNKFARAGISVSQPLINAYGTFLQGDSVLELTFEPAGSIEFSALPFMSAQQISRALNASVKVNRVNIPDAEFVVDAQQLTNFLFPAPVTSQPASKSAIVRPKQTFQLLGVQHIDRFIGDNVRLAQRYGKTVEGTLTATDKHQVDIDVSQSRSQGKVLRHLDRANITRFWVLSSDNLKSFAPASGDNDAADDEVIPRPSTGNAKNTPEISGAYKSGETDDKGRHEAEQEDIAAILKTIDRDNTTIIYEEGTDLDTPLAEGEYFEIIEVEDPEPVANPTMNDLPAYRSGTQPAKSAAE